MAEDESKEPPQRWNYMTQPLPDWVSGTMEERFLEIYRRRFWEAAESVSGPGSSIEQARLLIERLPLLWRDLGVRSVLDIPCGDFNWMREVDLSGVDYLGADIVPELVELNRSRFGTGKIRFARLDLTSDPLPTCGMVFCRDGLVHLSYADIGRALRNLSASGSTYLMATTFPGHLDNRDVATGDWRPLNFELPPLNFPPPLHLLIERCPEAGYEDKALGLWKIADLPEFEG